MVEDFAANVTVMLELCGAIVSRVSPPIIAVWVFGKSICLGRQSRVEFSVRVRKRRLLLSAR
jgi:hypothetical protein